MSPDGSSATLAEAAVNPVVLSVDSIWGVAGSLIGLEFQLFAYDEVFDSSLTISNITIDTVPVPLPGAML